LEKVLKEINIEWQDCEDFKLQGVSCDWSTDEKENGAKKFNFKDRVSKHKYNGKREIFTKVWLIRLEWNMIMIIIEGLTQEDWLHV
jgi:hypothetical protein